MLLHSFYVQIVVKHFLHYQVISNSIVFSPPAIYKWCLSVLIGMLHVEKLYYMCVWNSACWCAWQRFWNFRCVKLHVFLYIQPVLLVSAKLFFLVLSKYIPKDLTAYCIILSYLYVCNHCANECLISSSEDTLSQVSN